MSFCVSSHKVGDNQSPEKWESRKGNVERQNNFSLVPLYVVRKSVLAGDAFVVGMPKGGDKEDKGAFASTPTNSLLTYARSGVCAPFTELL